MHWFSFQARLKCQECLGFVLEIGRASESPEVVLRKLMPNERNKPQQKGANLPGNQEFFRATSLFFFL